MIGATHHDDDKYRRRRRRRGRPYLLCALLSSQRVRPSDAFTYRRRDLQLLSPEMICIAGVQHRDGSGGVSVQPCPTTPEEVANFDAVVMDEHGYVRITLRDIRMRDDGRQRVHREVTDDAYYVDRDRGGGSSRGAMSALWDRWFGSGGNDNRYLVEGEEAKEDDDEDHRGMGQQENDLDQGQHEQRNRLEDLVNEALAFPENLDVLKLQ